MERQNNQYLPLTAYPYSGRVGIDHATRTQCNNNNNNNNNNNDNDNNKQVKVIFSIKKSFDRAK